VACRGRRHADRLVGSVQDQQPTRGCDCGIDVRIGLRIAVYDDALGIGTRGKRGCELALGRRIDPEPLLDQHAEDRDGAAGLGREGHQPAPAAERQRLGVRPRTSAQGSGVVDVERCAVLGHELVDRAAADGQHAAVDVRAVGPGRSEQAHTRREVSPSGPGRAVITDARPGLRSPSKALSITRQHLLLRGMANILQPDAKARASAIRRSRAASCSATRSGEVPPGSERAATASPGVGSLKRSPAATRVATRS
jgi:hypothetical protein